MERSLGGRATCPLLYGGKKQPTMEEEQIKLLKDIMSLLRDKRKLGKETTTDFLLESAIAVYLKEIGEYKK